MFKLFLQNNKVLKANMHDLVLMRKYQHCEYTATELIKIEIMYNI